MQLAIPDKMPMPLHVHRREGEPGPRCQTTLEAVHYEDYVMTYSRRSRRAARCSRPTTLDVAQVSDQDGVRTPVQVGATRQVRVDRAS